MNTEKKNYMEISIIFPDDFAPSEKEFQYYCTVKLLKCKFITKEEALEMCGFTNSEN
jgi:hypothetical protein